MDEDPYQILGLTAAATADEIHRTYRRLAKRYHPDTMGSDGDHDPNLFIRLTKAYRTLCDIHKHLTPDFDAYSNSANSDTPLDKSAAGHVDLNLWRARDHKADIHPGRTHRVVSFETAMKGGTVPLGEGNASLLRIPAGARTGDRIPYRTPDGRPCEAELTVEDHPIFGRKGRDLCASLFMECPIARTVEIEVEALGGWRKLVVLQGAAAGTTLKVRGGGVGGVGDLLIRLADMSEAAFAKDKCVPWRFLENNSGHASDI